MGNTSNIGNQKNNSWPQNQLINILTLNMSTCVVKGTAIKDSWDLTNSAIFRLNAAFTLLMASMSSGHLPLPSKFTITAMQN